MIRGDTVQVILTPVYAPNTQDIERLVPVAMELRNGRLSDLGYWTRRSGYALAGEIQNPMPALLKQRVDEFKAMIRAGEEFFINHVTLLVIALEEVPGALPPEAVRLRDLIFTDMLAAGAGSGPMTIARLDDFVAAVTQIRSPVIALIPTTTHGAFAVTGTGQMFHLQASAIDELLPPLAFITDLLDGPSRLRWARYANQIILTNGARAMTLTLRDDNTVSYTRSVATPSTTSIVSLDSYLVVAVLDAAGAPTRRFRWSAPGQAVGDPGYGNWPAANYNDVREDVGTIRMIETLGRELYLFAERAIEVWVNVGGSQAFARRAVIPKGTQAGHSVVEANNGFYFLGEDRDFYRLDGDTPKVISTAIHERVRDLAHPEEVYGFDFRQEHCIRWFAPTDARCFVYDYLNNVFFEDDATSGDGSVFLPINAMMEYQGRIYTGDTEPTGYIYEWGPGHLTDDGKDIRVLRRMALTLSNDGRARRANRLRFRVGRTKPAPHAREIEAPERPGRRLFLTREPHRLEFDERFHQNTTAEMLLRWRFDRGTWSPFTRLRLGPSRTRGERLPENTYVDVYNLGLGRELELELTETNAMQYVVTHGYLTAEALLH